MAGAENRAGRGTGILLATAVALGGAGTAIVAYNKGHGDGYTDALATQPELTVHSPEFYSSIERFLSKDFTEIIEGATDTIANWGESMVIRFPYSTPHSAFTFDNKGLYLEDVYQPNHWLWTGENTVFPFSEYSEQLENERFYGLVYIPSSDVRVSVKTQGSFPVAYSLGRASQVIEGYPGYFLSLDWRGNVAERAKSEGVVSVDGTPFPQTEEVFEGFFKLTEGNDFSAEVFVLPK